MILWIFIKVIYVFSILFSVCVFNEEIESLKGRQVSQCAFWRGNRDASDRRVSNFICFFMFDEEIETLKSRKVLQYAF